MSFNEAKSGLSFLSLCASRMTFFLYRTFSSFQAGIVSSVFHCLSTAAFASGSFIALWHRNKLVNQILMVHRSVSSACNMIFMMLGLRQFRSWPRGFMKFYYTTISRLRNLCRCNQLTLSSPEAVAVHSFTGHGGCHRCFQFSPRIHHCIPTFFFIWINEINSSQLSSIFQFWHFNCPFLFSRF